MSMHDLELTGWELLTHGGLLVDAPRLSKLAENQPDPLSSYVIEELRRRHIAFIEEMKRLGDWFA